MNRYASDYVNKVLGQIRYKKVHNTISEELNNHILELAEGYISEGAGEEEAYRKAVSQMGDPIETGRKLHKTHRPKAEWSIFALLGTLVVYGLLIIFYYSYWFSTPEDFRRQILFGLIGIPVLAICYFIDYTKLEKYTLLAYFITCLLMVVALYFGTHRFGRAYIAIGGIGFYPSLVAIPLILLCYAGLVKRWCDGDIGNLLKLIGSAGLPLFIILIEPSFAYFLIVGASLLVMLTYGICSNKCFKADRKKTILVLYTCLFGLALLLFINFFGLQQPWRITRLTIFLNPERDPYGQGWLYMNMDKIITSAKLIGSGGDFSDMPDKPMSMLPGANSEFVLTFVIGSLGWIFGIVLIVLLGLIIFRLFLAAGKIRHTFGKYMCVGICCVFSLQVVVNVLMSLRLFPTFGVPLPFISFGGAVFLINMALIGLFLGVYRRKDILTEKV